MKSVRGPVAAVAGTCRERWTIPSPSGSRVTTVMSGTGGPLTVYVKDGSSPLTENTHRSAVPVPLAGRAMITGLPPSVHEDVATT